MTRIGSCTKWLLGPPITGKRAFLWSLAAIAVPTLIRASVDGIVSGVGFVPFIPSVLICALLLGWRYAAGVAIVSSVVADMLFVVPRYVFIAGPTDVFGMAIFLASSALIICLLQSFRNVIEDSGRPTGGGIIFSLEGGQAWASWSGTSYYLRLGRQEDVSERMEDFLAQVELGKRLIKDAR